MVHHSVIDQIRVQAGTSVRLRRLDAVTVVRPTALDDQSRAFLLKAAALLVVKFITIAVVLNCVTKLPRSSQLPPRRLLIGQLLLLVHRIVLASAASEIGRICLLIS